MDAQVTHTLTLDRRKQLEGGKEWNVLESTVLKEKSRKGAVGSFQNQSLGRMT